MTWLPRLGWLALTVVTLSLVAAAFLYKTPRPTTGLVIDRAFLQQGAQGQQDIRLPYRTPPTFGRIQDLHVVARFAMDEKFVDDTFALVPHANRRITIFVNGHRLFDGGVHAAWAGPLIGTPILMHFPAAVLLPGNNELKLVIESGQFAIPIYLSEVYIGREAELMPHFKHGLFIDERIKTAAFAAQLLLAIGILLIFVLRPKEPLFGWLAAMVSLSVATSIGLFMGFEPVLTWFVPYVAMLTPAIGIIAIGVACTVSGLAPPPIVRWSAIGLIGFTALLMLAGISPNRMVASMLAIPGIILAFFTATAILVWSSFWRSNTDARLLLAPYFLVNCLVIRDTSVALGILDRPFVFLVPYVRPLLLIAVLAVLMRRLVKTLDLLDRSNENLNLRLAEQEAELAVLHREERIEAARQVREHERQRLTHDLHDGISGHLVSIIAMTERAGDETRPIEQAARQALEDLRLVIYSLDLGEHDLPLALANFRERLIPQLRRIGVELDWSMTELPEISGVTPGNALMVLRILQEAITNALKHGPASKVAIRGSAGVAGTAVITIENDGRSFAPGGTGHGLANMDRRARQLGGALNIGALPQGAKLTLELPLSLPDLQESGA